MSESGGFREWLQTKAGTTATIIGVVVVIGVCVYAVHSSMAPPIDTSTRVFMDAGTTPPTPFRVTLTPGMPPSVSAPSGGKGYPAEACFWNKDGTAKTQPTYVLLNAYLGKPGPTFCPDCGRLVVMRNPTPEPGVSPPPTQAEYADSWQARSAAKEANADR